MGRELCVTYNKIGNRKIVRDARYAHARPRRILDSLSSAPYTYTGEGKTPHSNLRTLGALRVPLLEPVERRKKGSLLAAGAMSDGA